MKIAFVITPYIIYSGRSNGIRMQALDWKSALEERGHIVDLVNVWEHYDWSTYDAIHFFSAGYWLKLAELISQKNPNIAISPIIDSIKSPFMYKIASHMQVPALRLYSLNAAYRNASKYIKCHFARSEYETKFIKASVPSPNIAIVPLSPRVEASDSENIEREDFCFHLSSFTQPRKNVMRLMQAAVKYNFKLIVAGNKGPEKSFAPFKKFAEDHKENIKICGFLTEEEMLEYYSKAKVFALPSIEEGVGLVALEAAVRGCGIVITEIGGPKEYYGNLGHIVNPYSVDSIGKGVLDAMKSPNQPMLKKQIIEKYDRLKCADMIIEAYRTMQK